MGYLIYKSNKGIVFTRTDKNGRSIVTVANDNPRHIHRKYVFPNIPADTFESPYISRENLNCCGGRNCDESYLLTAVQKGKKLCAGIVMDDKNKHCAYIETLNDNYPHFCRPLVRNGPYTFYYVDVTRKGCISDYIDMSAVRETYRLPGINHLNFDIIGKHADTPMIHLPDGKAGFAYANPGNDENYVTAGLLLGYPPESTAALLCE